VDAIRLRGVRIWGRHGVGAKERKVPQPFDIDLELELDLRVPQESDDLADTLDYAALHRRMVDVVTHTSFSLLERLARALLDAACEDPRVRRACVTVAKPGILGGATPAVTLTRVRTPEA